MSLTVDPIRAAAILLPILMLMDATALRPWWGQWDVRNLRTTAVGAVLGTVLGFVTFGLLSTSALRVLIGGIALVFALRWWFAREPGPPRVASYARGTFWSTLAGFTSFSVHGGGPPLHIYLLSQRLDKSTFQATTVVFFFGVNWLKLAPYAWLGQLDGSNLTTSLVLAPLAPIGIGLGTWLHDRIDGRIFFRIVYASLLVLGLKLIDPPPSDRSSGSVRIERRRCGSREGRDQAPASPNRWPMGKGQREETDMSTPSTKGSAISLLFEDLREFVSQGVISEEDLARYLQPDDRKLLEQPPSCSGWYCVESHRRALELIRDTVGHGSNA